MVCNKGKKLGSFLAAAALCLLIAAPGAQAHDFWVNPKAPSGNVVEAELGYGHDFPNPEAIAEDRTGLFEPLTLVTSEGVVDLKQEGANYSFKAEKELKKGSYLISGVYRPTFWSKGPDGWSQTNRKQRPDATYCEEAAMFAKGVFNVDGAADDELVTKPLGHRLEIVPLKNPSKVKVGETLPVQVLFDGNPLKMAEVSATFAGFSANKEHKAFYGRADLKGIIELVPLKEGYWFAKVTHKYDFEDKSLCDEVVLVATLTFNIEK